MESRWEEERASGESSDPPAEQRTAGDGIDAAAGGDGAPGADHAPQIRAADGVGEGLTRVQCYEQAQKVGAPVSLSQILGRVGAAGAASSRATCERPGAVVATPPSSAAPADAQVRPNHPAEGSKMGHGASCLTGRETAQAANAASNNCSVTSFTPLQPNHHGGRTAPGAVSGAAAAKNAAANSGRVPDDYAYLCGLVPELKMELKERDTRIDTLQNETLDLKRRLKKRDEEIGRLQREIHKLKVSDVRFHTFSGLNTAVT